MMGSKMIICAPSNLGLRPEAGGREPGTWESPLVLLSEGLQAAIEAAEVEWLPRPAYRFNAEENTRIRNGHAIRNYSLDLAHLVQARLSDGKFPVVIGGDCSILLGCLAGARAQDRVGLLHVDGHSDFFHPGNYDVRSRLGTAAGMDLALVTGRGEKLLTEWPGIDGPLVRDEDVTQMGEREALSPDYARHYGDIRETAINRIIVQDMLREGMQSTAKGVAAWASRRDLSRYWLHLDVDVLAETVMPAVDSPGEPGLDFEQVARLVSLLIRHVPVIGVDVTIYDPDKDPDRRHAKAIVECLGNALGYRATGPENGFAFRRRRKIT
ncbi:arginase family protein [Ciceribacter azotifigens]|uniref:arginase family protein n=1 Tax=Ciceribacter azotifigens TaxID=2069303 RepID=UPI003A879CBD